LGHSRPGRADSRSSHGRCASKRKFPEHERLDAIFSAKAVADREAPARRQLRHAH
jgi:hypothetical protein